MSKTTTSESSNGSIRYDTGMRIRREVLGSVHVDASLAKSSEFARPVQELVTEYCWGTIWSGEGIDRRTRSMLNLATLTDLNRTHELGVHVRGAITNGVTPSEIREVLLQTAVYAGVPAALESFRGAERVLDEIGAIDG